MPTGIPKNGINKSWFIKGHRGYKAMLGKKQSKKAKEKIRRNRKGKCMGEDNPSKRPEVREKIRQFRLGKKASKITKAKQKKSIKIAVNRLEVREKMSKAKSGKNNPNWRDGLSNNPYPKEFNSELKLKIRTRDNFICCLCGKTEREELEELNRVLCVNHIDFDKSNCKENNLNTLCLKCNVKINREREYWTEYFQIYE